eukprot:PhM_4_TR4780/c0_g1_i1/m.58937/K00111/glpA, glpD; glycerol-3-phosphate dehydrogenase
MSSFRQHARKGLMGSVVGAAGVFIGLTQFPSLTRRRFDDNLPPHYPAPNHDAPTRETQIRSLKQSKNHPFDVLIIGGGATGAGCALDARLRGLNVALVEGDDFASGTSSRSTKLIHGGVRYLEKAFMNLDVQQLNLVFEALSERAILIHQAPHLCNALPTMLPCYRWWEVPFYYLGLKGYDFVAAAGRGTLHNSYFVTAGESQLQFPTLSPKLPTGESLYGSIVYYDGQMDDARLNVSIALTAACYGAVTVNHAPVTSLIKDKDGCAIGAKVKDSLTGETIEVRAKAVINATGPLTDNIRRMGNPKIDNIIVPSAGVHVTLPAFYSAKTHGLIVPKTKDGRVVFMLPWQGQTIAGTTDSVVEVTNEPRAAAADVEFILSSLRDYLSIDVDVMDVKSVWCGIRPLAVDPNATESKNILREHSVFVSPTDKVVTITGGKWTTYRKMAQDAVDATIELLKKQNNSQTAHLTSCSTDNLRLIGARRFSPELYVGLAQKHRAVLAPDVAEHLARSYGDRAEIVAHMADHGDRALSKRLVDGFPTIEAEVKYCATHEYAESAVDFLARRSRLAFLDVEAARKSVGRVVDIMGDVKAWDGVRRRKEVKKAETYLELFTA